MVLRERSVVTHVQNVLDELLKPTQPRAFSKLVKRQIQILKQCESTGSNLSQVLESEGLTYDDLRYNFTAPISSNTDRYYTLDDFSKKAHDIPMVSFFSGCGGMDLGFKAAGFRHEALIDNNEVFCNTLRINYPSFNVSGLPICTSDVSDFETLSSLLRKKLGRCKFFDGVFVGGPPCQPFSIAANQRFKKSEKNFKRTGFDHKTNGNLLFDFIRFIVEFKPYAFLIENVTGLLDIDGGKQVSNATKLLSGSGYQVAAPLIVDAQFYRVPQQRRRLFLIGSRSCKSLTVPQPSTKLVSCWKALEKTLEGVENHVTRKHKADSVFRYMSLVVGERDQLGRVDRLDPNRPSKTVIAGGTRGGGRSHLHPNIPRTLSVRECARLQTFPDDFIFSGAHARQFTQVGNAVPPVLAAQLAGSILDSFFF